MKALLVAALLVTSVTAHAETIVVAGVELRLPADWEKKAKGPITLLVPKKYKGRALEVVALKAMPQATPAAFKTLLGGGDKLELTAVREGDREGTKVIAASGKVVTPKGEVAVDLLTVPVKDKATMLISFVGADQDPVIKQANIDILKTARVPGPRISFVHTPPKTSTMVAPPQELVDGLKKIAVAFDTSLRLPRPLTISFVECGMINARYIGAKHAIEMCHDLYDDLLKLFAKAGMDQKQASVISAGAFMFIFLHEFGHALVGELDLPITGKGEDAADEIATLILAKNPKTQPIALAGAAWFETKTKQPGHKDNYWSTHSFDSVRFESIMCLMFGADPKAIGPIMAKYKVGKNKLAKCARDTPQRLAAWKKMLAPYAVKK